MLLFISAINSKKNKRHVFNAIIIKIFTAYLITYLLNVYFMFVLCYTIINVTLVTSVNSNMKNCTVQLENRF